MLVELHLRDLGVIGEASIELSEGLNVVTGETGVGKTLLVTSLALLTGSRGHARLVRDGAAEAVVQALISTPERLQRHLDASDLPADDELVIVRRLTSDGRSRAWLGGQLVPVSTLADVGGRIVELHGQAAGFALAKASLQLEAIDALAGNADLLARYRVALMTLRELERDHASLHANEMAREREREILSFQIEEIDRADLERDEDDTIHASLARLEHAERLRDVGSQVVSLAGAEGAAGELAEAHKALDGAAAIDREAEPLASRLGDVAAEVAELARDIRSWADELNADPAQLETLRERKALIASLKRKYGTTIAEILDFAESSRVRLTELEAADERIATIGESIRAARGEVERLGAELTTRRLRAAKSLAKEVAAELPALALPHARFSIDHQTSDASGDGCDAFEFRFSSTAGQPLQPIGKVASGGELSRAMIAVTLVLAKAHDVPVLVFDEADQGIGGEAALELGRRLARLARSHQVLVVSHLPQIAAFADRHIAVRRSDDEVRVEVLGDEDRLAEISRMLAGLESSSRARAHAAELLDMARGESNSHATDDRSRRSSRDSKAPKRLVPTEG